MRVISAVAAAILLAVAPMTASAAAAAPASAQAVASFAAGSAPAAGSPYDGITVTVGDSLFFADRSTFRVTVHNAHTYQVRVAVTAWTADSRRLDIDGTPVTVVVPPGAQAEAQFPATAVSNGTVAVSAAIVGANGQIAPGTVSTATFNVQAGWETPVVLVIAGLVLVLAVIGVIRTVRRVRRARTAAGPGPDATTDERG